MQQVSFLQKKKKRRSKRNPSEKRSKRKKVYSLPGTQYIKEKLGITINKFISECIQYTTTKHPTFQNTQKKLQKISVYRESNSLSTLHLLGFHIDPTHGTFLYRQKIKWMLNEKFSGFFLVINGNLIALR